MPQYSHTFMMVNLLLFPSSNSETGTGLLTLPFLYRQRVPTLRVVSSHKRILASSADRKDKWLTVGEIAHRRTRSSSCLTFQLSLDMKKSILSTIIATCAALWKRYDGSRQSSCKGYLHLCYYRVWTRLRDGVELQLVLVSPSLIDGAQDCFTTFGVGSAWAEVVS